MNNKKERFKLEFPNGLPVCGIGRNSAELRASVIVLRGIVWNCAKITGSAIARK